jgi:hypothetical protein
MTYLNNKYNNVNYFNTEILKHSSWTLKTFKLINYIIINFIISMVNLFLLLYGIYYLQ